MITVDVADLDPDPSTILDLLREGECSVKAWLRIALEYWKLGQLDAATAVAEAAASCASPFCVYLVVDVSLLCIFTRLMLNSP